MPLSHEQVHKLEQWWDSTGVERKCPMCGHGQWEAGEIISGTDVSGQGAKPSANSPRDVLLSLEVAHSLQEGSGFLLGAPTR